MKQLKSFSLLAILIVVSCLFSACSKKSVNVIKPRKQIIHQQFVELAQTHLDHPVTISMPFSGELGAQLHLLSLRPGDIVKRGQVLIQLKQEPLKLALSHAKSMVKIDQAHYRLAEHQLVRLDRENAYAQRSLSRYQRLSAKSHISSEILEQYSLKAHHASEALAQQKVRLNLLSEKIVSAKKATKLAQYRLRESQIRSPIDGRIIQVFHHGGSALNAGAAIMTVGDLSKLDVISHVLSTRLHQVKVGDKVSIGFSRVSFPLRGKINRIHPQGFREISPLGVRERRVPVIIKPDDLKKFPLVVGYRLYVEFTTHSYQSLTVPASAVLIDKSGRYFVYVVYQNKLVKRVVSTGIESHARIAVLSGLRESDLVVEFPTSGLKPGESVVANPNSP